MAPESLLSKGYDHKVDVWACGIIYFQLITGQFVFNATNVKELAQKIKDGDWSFPKMIEFSMQGLDFLNCTLQYDVNKRLNWKQLCTHPYLTMDQSEIVPITFNTNEETGELLPVQSGNDGGDFDDLISVAGSVININTRKSLNYRDYYTKQVEAFKKASGIHLTDD